MINRNFFIGLLTGSSLLILVPIAFYLKTFHNNAVSESPEQWGQFGDFIGGLLNPLIAFLTLIVTVIIASTLRSFEAQRHSNEVEIQKQLTLVTIKQQQFSKFMEIIQRVFHSIGDKEKYPVEIDGGLIELSLFRKLNEDLLPSVLKEEYQKLLDDMKDLEDYLDSLYSEQLEETEEGFKARIEQASKHVQVVADHIRNDISNK